RRPLEPLGDGDGVAHGGGAVAAHAAPEDVAGVDADAHAEGELPLGVEGGELALHGEPGADGAGRVVRVGGGRAEDGHDGVADELVDGPALALDGGAEAP